MCINVQLCQCTNIYFVFAFSCYIRCEPFIQAMNTLNNNGLIFLQLQEIIVAPFPLSRNEIVVRNLYLMSI